MTDTKLKLARIDYDYTVVPTMMARRFESLMNSSYTVNQQYADAAYTVFSVDKRAKGQ